MDIAHARLRNQSIENSPHATAAEVVTSMVAVQAQDYLGALWAIGLRMRTATERMVEQALADRLVVRTWPLRGTLHFVAADDVRWLLELAAPRMIERNRRRLGDEFAIDETRVAHARRVCERVLGGGRQLTRDALYAAFESERIATGAQRGLHLLWWLALERVICFGAREGKQQTFVLLDEWLPATRRLSRDAALAELALRYFTSRGPATLQDFTWWSGLAAADAASALEMVAPQLVQETIDKRVFWFAQTPKPRSKAKTPRVHLLPAWDEYAVAYRDRSVALDPVHAHRADAGNGIFRPPVLVDGRIAGTWKRSFGKGGVAIDATPFDAWSPAVRDEVIAAGTRYAAFHQKAVVSSPADINAGAGTSRSVRKKAM
jgi:hypothetical protein